MNILDKILRRNRAADHERWLEAHPGKGKVTMEAPGISEAEEAGTRARMEAELDAQRARRGSE
jgi:hypothetical protein